MYKTFYKDDDFDISWDLVNDNLWVHLHLNKASRPILLKALEAWAMFKAHAYFSGFDAVYSYTEEKRILKFFPNSILIGKIDDIEVVKWDLE